MRISEILTESVINEVTRPDIDAAKEILTKAGYKMIGGGFESLVFQRPGDPYVLKLIDAYATAYFDFIKLSQSTNNIHFPKFKGQLINVLPGYYLAIRMEPLTPYKGEYKTISALERYAVQFQRANGDESKMNPDVVQQINDVEVVQPGIKKACQLIAMHLFAKEHYESDMAAQNTMMRGNTIVITDPVMFDDNEY